MDWRLKILLALLLVLPLLGAGIWLLAGAAEPEVPTLEAAPVPPPPPLEEYR